MRTGKNYVKWVIGGFLFFAICGGLYWLLHQSDNETKRETRNQEFISLQVVQFYLHLPGGDIIIGRKNPNFRKVLQLAEDVVTSVSEPLVSPLEGVREVEKAVYEIQSNSVALSVWLINPQKISTKIPAKDGEIADKFKNRVIETDRIMIVLGGKYMGQVLTKEPGRDDKWLAWKVSHEQLMRLVDVVRVGGL
ncbi:hypothetical protein Tfer_2069 [Thermincola ferriacetica]|uniref:Uncharacterized protein n=1 Tax=Thermincola ferriacetica TaxID=281456 RepID=A0A0L6W117_9FIRM|nr:hypothetical protein [Thermincola ferriacetica]KNZ69272.1 hypothetical protein Tfer_2069 [Thermincola ferriacetica]